MFVLGEKELNRFLNSLKRGWGIMIKKEIEVLYPFTLGEKEINRFLNSLKERAGCHDKKEIL